MDLGLKGKVAVVTGATAGIGLAVARKFVEEGARVAFCGRRAELVAATAQELTALGGEVFGQAADISKADDIAGFFKAAIAHFGRVDILVNNAGSSKAGPFMDITDADWEADLELKLYGAVRCVRQAVPEMKKQGGGRIVNVTNIGAKAPGGASVPTTVSRAAGLALTKSLSKALAPDNILVNAVCIGKIKSTQHDRTAQRRGVELDALYDQFGGQIPLGRVGEAEEAANVIVFLCSGPSSYVTGTALNLDGGASPVL